MNYAETFGISLLGSQETLLLLCETITLSRSFLHINLDRKATKESVRTAANWEEAEKGERLSL